MVETVIPLPRPWVLSSAMLAGVAVGILAAVGASLAVDTRIRPDVVITLVVGVPSVFGLMMVATSARRWMTALGAFVLAVAPGWFGSLVLIEAVMGG